MFLIILLYCPPAHGADKWTQEDKALQVGVTVLTAVDWLQTRAIAKNPDKHWEFNPLLGEHPNVRRVDRYFFCSVIIKNLVTHILPQEWRKAWQGFCIGASSALIVGNDSVGISISKAF